MRSLTIRSPRGAVAELGTALDYETAGAPAVWLQTPVEQHLYVVIYRQLNGNFSLVSRERISQPIGRAGTPVMLCIHTAEAPGSISGQDTAYPNCSLS
jgi:hypothetical protein